MPSEAALFAARARAARRARQRRVAVALSVVLLPPVALAGAAFSPLLDVDHVRVRGASRVAASEVVAAAAVPPGTPLIDADLSGIGRRVGALRGIKSVTVRRSWPSSLDVVVVERVPAVAVPRSAGADLYDAEGVLVTRAGTVPSGVPSLRVTNGGTPDAALVRAAVTLVATLPPALRSRVTGLSATSAGDLTAAFRDGSEVVWGDASAPKEKLAALLALLPRGARHYDVRAPGIPSAR